MKQLLFFVFLTLLIARTDAQEYPKAILPGDYPDPSIMRDGEDYYMINTMMNAGIRGFCHGSRSVEI